MIVDLIRHNRLIDLSRKAATLLGFKKKGTARVRVKYISRAPMNGDDSLERRVLASKGHGTLQASYAPTRRLQPQRRHTGYGNQRAPYGIGQKHRDVFDPFGE